eukprot:8028310-Lingulodinium_polyedra.AAC.1
MAPWRPSLACLAVRARLASAKAPPPRWGGSPPLRPTAAPWRARPVAYPSGQRWTRSFAAAP